MIVIQRVRTTCWLVGKGAWRLFLVEECSMAKRKTEQLELMIIHLLAKHAWLRSKTFERN